ncbi:MAG TPA: hypothetical protein PKU97_12515 [Kofleriaceae bacterium]|nr:hypothetical protein [Kofleriaceae bacterium]
MSPTYALAHVFLPNLARLQGPNNFVSAAEMGKKEFFEQVWAQAQMGYTGRTFFLARDPYRIAVVELPEPKEAGEAHMVAVVTRKTEQWFWKFFTLEMDYVLTTRSFRTMICERDGNKHRKIGPGPALTGAFERDATEFADAALLPIISGRGIAEAR